MVIKPILWNHYQKDDGTSQVKIRITINRKTSYYPVEVYVTEKDFNPGAHGNWVKASRVNSATLNAKIKNAYYKVEAFSLKNSGLSAKEITSGVDGNSESFYEHFQKKIDYAKSAFSYGTYKRLKSVQEKMKEFSPDLNLREFDIHFLRRYEAWLIDTKKNSVNTISANFSAIKAIVSDLVKHGKVEYIDNPFLHYKMRKENVKRERLSATDIDKIIELKLKEGSLQWHVRNVYLFSFYCAGIRFADLCRLSWAHVVEVNGSNRLIYTMGKTTKHRSIKLLTKASDILKCYNGSTIFIFPMLKAVMTPEDIFTQISSMNALYNHTLKLLARIAEINDKISFHTARHSFADWAIKKGIDIHTLKDLLGHDKVATTEIYAKDFYEEEADNAMHKLFGE